MTVTTAPVEVRRLDAADAPGVRSAAAVTLAAYDALPGLDVGPYRDELADVGARAAAAEVLVAVVDGRIVGCVTYVADAENPYAEFTDPDAAGIRMLAVEPGAQGHGVGAALVDGCLARARRGRRRLVVLHTTGAMGAARAIYVRRGFVRAPARDWRPRPDILLLGYELRL